MELRKFILSIILFIVFCLIIYILGCIDLKLVKALFMTLGWWTVFTINDKIVDWILKKK